MIVAALATTYARLPRVPYLALATVVALLAINGLIFAQLIAGIVGPGDLAFDSAVALGHPAAGTALENAVRMDASALSLHWIETQEVEWLANVELAESGARGMQATYGDTDRQAFLTVLSFESRQASNAFFDRWGKNAMGSLRLMEIRQSWPAGGSSTASTTLGPAGPTAPGRSIPGCTSSRCRGPMRRRRPWPGR
ncbi:MAG TPA: hypothetical protein PLJ35_02940 [Anaerolineae bacterium]|nr:hypothetical protein [Anaerolineae bacterium]HPL29450.1 hypothetical protein [Anaerolineae bacterium]